MCIISHPTLITADYPDERIQALNANHRDICKFDSPNDTNFRTLRNRLAATVEDIERSSMYPEVSLRNFSDLNLKYRKANTRHIARKCKQSQDF